MRAMASADYVYNATAGKAEFMLKEPSSRSRFRALSRPLYGHTPARARRASRVYNAAMTD